MSDFDASWYTPLAERLVLEPADDADVFRTHLSGFGGDTLGCAALAAGRTCADRPMTSLHAYFLRGFQDAPAELAVERVRDGRRFAHRRVSVRVDGKLACEVVACFGVPGEGIDYQERHPVPDAAPPESLPDEEAIARAEGWKRGEPGPLFGPIEFRWVGGPPWRAPSPTGPTQYRTWVRPRAPIPDDPAFQAAALGFLADEHSHMPAARLTGSFEPFGYTSLDQTLWLHRLEPWTDWRLLTTAADIAHASRTFARRTLHARDGRLLASMSQEQLLT